MFTRKKKEVQLDEPGTIIGSGTTIKSSKLIGEKPVRIDGVFFGDIEVQSGVVIGEEGRVEGNINSPHVIIAGKIKGNIESESLHLTNTADVNGDVKSTILITDEGSTLNGQYNVSQNGTNEIRNSIILNKETVGDNNNE